MEVVLVAGGAAVPAGAAPGFIAAAPGGGLVACAVHEVRRPWLIGKSTFDVRIATAQLRPSQVPAALIPLLREEDGPSAHATRDADAALLDDDDDEEEGDDDDVDDGGGGGEAMRGGGDGAFEDEDEDERGHGMIVGGGPRRRGEGGGGGKRGRGCHGAIGGGGRLGMLASQLDAPLVTLPSTAPLTATAGVEAPDTVTLMISLRNAIVLGVEEGVLCIEAPSTFATAAPPTPMAQPASMGMSGAGQHARHDRKVHLFHISSPALFEAMMADLAAAVARLDEAGLGATSPKPTMVGRSPTITTRLGRDPSALDMRWNEPRAPTAGGGGERQARWRSTMTTTLQSRCQQLPPPSRFLSPAVLRRLRYMRANPDRLFQRLASSWALLVVACRQWERGVASLLLQPAAAALPSAGAPAPQPLTATIPPGANRGESAGSGGASGPAVDGDGDGDGDVWVDESKEQRAYVRRHAWCVIAGHYFTPLADLYTAGPIFDMLTAQSMPVTFVDILPGVSMAPPPPPTPSVGPPDATPSANGGGGGGSGSAPPPPPPMRTTSLELGTGGGGSSSSSSSAPGSAPLPAVGGDTEGGVGDGPTSISFQEHNEHVLVYDTFEKYASALGRPWCNPPAAWESLRDDLSLDSREVCVKVEEYVEMRINVVALVAVSPQVLKHCMLTLASMSGRPRQSSYVEEGQTSGGVRGVDGVDGVGEGIPPHLKRVHGAHALSSQHVPVVDASEVCDLPLPLPSSVVTALQAEGGVVEAPPNRRTTTAATVTTPSSPAPTPKPGATSVASTTAVGCGGGGNGASSMGATGATAGPPSATATAPPPPLFQVGRHVRKFIKDRDDAAAALITGELYGSSSDYDSDVVEPATSAAANPAAVRHARRYNGTGRGTSDGMLSPLVRPRTSSTSAGGGGPGGGGGRGGGPVDDDMGEMRQLWSELDGGDGEGGGVAGGGGRGDGGELEERGLTAAGTIRSAIATAQTRATTFLRRRIGRGGTSAGSDAANEGLGGAVEDWGEDGGEKEDPRPGGPPPAHPDAPTRHRASFVSFVTQGASAMLKRATDGLRRGGPGGPAAMALSPPSGTGGGSAATPTMASGGGTPTPVPSGVASGASHPALGVGLAVGAMGSGSPGLGTHPAGLRAARQLLALASRLGWHMPTFADLICNGRAEVRLRGTLILTDRNLYLRNRNEVAIIPIASLPLGSIANVRTFNKTLGMNLLARMSDNGLGLGTCELRRVVVDPELEAETAGDGALSPFFTACAAGELLRGVVVPCHLDRIQTRRSGGADGKDKALAPGSGGGGGLGGTATSKRSPVLAGAVAVGGGGGEGGGPGGHASATTPAPSSTPLPSNAADAIMDSLFLPPATPTPAAGKGVGDAAATSTPKAGVAMPKPAGRQEALVPGVLLLRPAVTLIFSKVKDLLLNRGEERTGGRRQVVGHALEEVIAAHHVAPGLNTVLLELIEDQRRRESSQGGWCCRRGGGACTAATAGGPAGRGAAWTGPGDGGVGSDGGATDSDAGGGGDEPSVSSQVHPALRHAATGHLTFSTLLFTSKVSVQHWKALLVRDRADEALFSRRLHAYAAINVVRTRALLKATGRVATSLYLCHNYITGADSAASIIIRRFMLEDDPRWVMRLARWVSHDRAVRRRRYESLRQFSRQRFKSEFDTMLDTIFFPINTLRHLILYVYCWETPLASLVVYTTLLLIAWHDLLGHLFPLTLLSIAFLLLLFGSLTPGYKARVIAFCTRPRTTSAKTIYGKLIRFRDTLANNQVRMNKFNTAALRLRSLLLWRDMDRTKLFMFLLTLAALICAAVPARWLTIAFCVLQLTKPLRSQGAGLATLAARRFVDGLPVAGPSDPVYADIEMDPVESVLTALEAVQSRAGGAGPTLSPGAPATLMAGLGAGGTLLPGPITAGGVQVQFLR